MIRSINLLFFFGLFTGEVYSQNFLDDSEAIKNYISSSELDKYMNSNRKKGINGNYLFGLTPTPSLDLTSNCQKDNRKDSRYELILVSSFNNQPSQLKEEALQYSYYSTDQLERLKVQYAKNFEKALLNKDSIKNLASEIWRGETYSPSSTELDLNSTMGKDLVVEGLLHVAARTNFNEKDLSRALAETISGLYQSDEEKYQILSKLSSRLYRNYNDPRNPGSNTATFNPTNAPLPPGDLTLNEMLQAASAFDHLRGGVCNDVSESIMMIGEELFPDKDVLAVNGGTHFGVVISSGKNHRVIDGMQSYSMTNKLILDPKFSTTNLRLSKMKDGKLKEIAVVDTQMGQVVESAFETGKNLLKTDTDISSLMGHLKKNKMTYSGGTANLSDSKVFIVVAKYENTSDKWKSYVGTGLSSQMFNDQLEKKYQFHLKAGVERKIFHYIGPRSAVNLSSGLRASGMYSLGQPGSGGGSISSIEMSGSLDQYNKLNIELGNKNRPDFKLNSTLEVEHTLGPSSWGDLTGQLSSVESKDVPPVLKNLSFHLNQVNADITVQDKMNKNIGYYTNLHYQGSNIGQSINLISGLTIEAPKEAQILVFTGYINTEIKGYETNNSLIGTPSGLQAGVRYKNRSGVQSGVVVRGIAGRLSVEGTIKIPLDGKKKNQRK
jgi:hypothetical protein